MTNDEKYMRRCLELARLANGNTAPNPLVGAVIVHEGKIIGEGYHRLYGEAHAESIAIDSVRNRKLLKDSTLYVNLEPCAHYGHTPPCADRIVREGIPRVVIGTRDPSTKVAGKGLDILRKGGCQVTERVLGEECQEINRRFITFHKKKRPYVILKWAQTLDGFIDMERKKEDPIQPNWITNEVSKRLVHKWRSEEQAILVGSHTTLKDNPRLNVREWHGKNPLRIVIDRFLEMHDKLELVRDPYPTLILTDVDSNPAKAERLSKYPLEIVRMDFRKDLLNQLMDHLHQRDISSLFVEGGEYTISRFMESNLWDEARVLIGNKNFQSGVKAPVMPATQIDKQGELHETHLYVFYNR